MWSLGADKRLLDLGAGGRGDDGIKPPFYPGSGYQIQKNYREAPAGLSKLDQQRLGRSLQLKRESVGLVSSDSVTLSTCLRHPTGLHFGCSSKRSEVTPLRIRRDKHGGKLSVHGNSLVTSGALLLMSRGRQRCSIVGPSAGWAGHPTTPGSLRPPQRGEACRRRGPSDRFGSIAGLRRYGGVVLSGGARGGLQVYAPVGGRQARQSASAISRPITAAVGGPLTPRDPRPSHFCEFRATEADPTPVRQVGEPPPALGLFWRHRETVDHRALPG